MRAAWESSGVMRQADANSGSPQGIGELVENRKDGVRQLASTIYPLGGVHVMTEILVKCVLIETRESRQVAIGVQLTDQRIFLSSKEVILLAGTYRTPQLLMLSGVGPAEELEKARNSGESRHTLRGQESP